jgi:hypothetical protein
MAMATTTKASKPTLLIIPVAASPADLYRDVANYLETSGGYEVQVHDLLSASRVPPQEPAGLPEDAEFFHGKFQELPDAGQDVVVLCHWWSCCDRCSTWSRQRGSDAHRIGRRHCKDRVLDLHRWAGGRSVRRHLQGFPQT